MKKTKTNKILFGATLSVLSIFGMAACSSKEDGESALKALILQQEGKIVKEDFTVPVKVRGLNVKWSSSDDSVASIVDKDDTSKYIQITRPDASKAVTLTATVNGASREYAITVDPVDVYEIADSFTFEQAGTSVYEDFDLPLTYDYKLVHASETTPYATKTATLSWSSNKPESISIDDNGHVTVTPSYSKKEVALTCTFTYNGSSSNYKYTVNTFKEVSAADKLMNFYNDPSSAEKQTIRGWVIAKEAYADKYKNTSVYVLDESKTGGICAYRLKCDSQADYDKLAIGSPIEVTGAPTEYNGLVEMASGCTFIIPSDMQNIDVSNEYQAIDKSVIVGDDYWRGTSMIKYKTSSLVSLTGWKIEEIGKASASSPAPSQTVLTVSKNDVKVSVAINKNLIALDSDAAKTIIGYQTTFKKGDIVNIKGILGYYKGYQVIADGVDSVVAATEESSVSVANIAAAKVALDNLPTTVSSTQAIELPSSTDDIKYSYTVESKVATLDGNTLNVVPTSELNETIVNVTVTADGLTYTKSLTIVCQTLDDEGMINAELENISIDYTNPGNFNLATEGSQFTDVKFTYEIVSGTAATIVGSKVRFIPAKDEDSTVTIKVIGKLGEVTKEKEISVVVKAYKDLVKTTTEASQLDDNKTIVVSGEITKYYTSNNATSGVYISDGTTEYLIFKLYDENQKALAADAYPTIGSTITVYGTTTSYTKNDNTTKELINSVTLELTIAELTDAEKAQYALDAAKKKFAETYETDTTITLGDGISAVIKSGSTATVEEGKVVITPTDEEVEVVVTLTATSGSETKTEDVTFKTKKPAAVAPAAGEFTSDYIKVSAGVNIEYGDVSSHFKDVPAAVSSIVVNKADSTTKPRIDGYSMRVYQGSEMVITAVDGFKFTSCTFDYGEQSGTVYNGAVITISEDGKTVTITCPTEKHFRITAIHLTIVAE